MSAPLQNWQGNKAFSREVPRLQIAWDSTSLGTLKACPRKYEYTMILGRQPRDTSPHLIFGGHYHKALEIYDHEKSKGASHEAAQREAVRYCFTGTVTRKPDGRFKIWFSDEPGKTRRTLVRSIIWYLEHFKNDPLQTIQLSNGKPAVELSFRFDTGVETAAGESYLLCGHIDRLVSSDGNVHVLDRKTTKAAITPKTFQAYGTDGQMSLYDFAASVIWSVPVKGVILDIAQILVTMTRFRRGFTHRTPGHREEFFRTTMHHIKMAESFAEAEFWPMNDMSCQNYGGCPFREICTKGPETRAKWLKSLTKPRRWDPLEVRGDV